MHHYKKYIQSNPTLRPGQVYPKGGTMNFLLIFNFQNGKRCVRGRNFLVPYLFICVFTFHSDVQVNKILNLYEK